MPPSWNKPAGITFSAKALVESAKSFFDTHNPTPLENKLILRYNSGIEVSDFRLFTQKELVMCHLYVDVHHMHINPEFLSGKLRAGTCVRGCMCK